MGKRAFYSAIAALGSLFFSYQAFAVPDPFTILDGAGPQNWAVLEIGNGNVSIANASGAGFITGNVGVDNSVSGSLSDSGTPITGNVVTSSSSDLNPNVAPKVSGTITQDPALLNLDAIAANNASTAAGGLSSFGGGLTSSLIVGGSINLNTGLTYNLAPGVYNLSSLTLQNGTILDLVAGGSYVFNISSSLALNSSRILDSTSDDVLFNILPGAGVGFSGGLSQESVLDGILLAPDSNVNLTPGLIVGEIISGGNINIASGAQVKGVTSVPDSGSSLFLLSIGLGCLCLFQARKKFLCLIPFHSPDVSERFGQ